MARVLVTGGRDFEDESLIFARLDHLHAASHECTGIDVLIHGAARGVDSIAAYWASMREVSVEAYPADWKTHGKSAGPIRNRRMLKEGRPDLVVAFPGGRGTADMVKAAQSAGVKVIDLRNER